MHFALIEVAKSENLKAERLQCIGHYPPIVYGARRAVRRLVRGVTDDERNVFPQLFREAALDHSKSAKQTKNRATGISTLSALLLRILTTSRRT